MRRTVATLLVASGVASAEPAPEAVDGQAISADLGVAGGGRVTPGGLRIAGHFLYQLSDRDWFDGGASFTYGGGSAQCFRDRADQFVCEHGFADGKAIELVASLRRWYAPQGAFHPFLRAGVGLALVGFSADSVSGLAFPLHAGGGVRAEVIPGFAIVVQADVELGVGVFNHALGIEPQAGAAVLAGAEFRLP